MGALAVVNGVITVTYSNATPQRANANINAATITLVPYVSGRPVGLVEVPRCRLDRRPDDEPDARCRERGGGTVLAKYSPAECRA